MMAAAGCAGAGRQRKAMSGMPKERMAAAREQQRTSSEADHAKVKAIAGIVRRGHGPGPRRRLDPQPRGCAADLNLLGSTDKELFRIEGTTRRFQDGYNHFGRHLEKILAFFDRHMA